MKKIKKIFVIGMFFALLTGCYSPVNLQDRAIITAAGIDYKNNRFIITLCEFSASTDSKNEKSSEKNGVTEAEGKTLFDALKNSEEKIGKKIFFGHTNFFIIGYNAAQKGIQEIFEFMNSNYQLSLNSSVLVTKQTAKEILNQDIFSKSTQDLSLSTIEKGGKIVETSILDALKDSYNLNGTFVLPLISLDGNGGVDIKNCVIFKGAKPQIALNSDETMGLCWIEKKIQDASLSFNFNDENVSVNVVSDSSKIDLIRDKDGFIVKIDITAHGSAPKTETLKMEKSDKKYIENLENEVEKKIKQQIDSFLYTTIKKNNCDVLNVSKRIENIKIKKGQPTKSWLPETKFNVNVAFTINRLGVWIK